MSLRKPLILALAIHIFLIIFLIIMLPEAKVVEEEESISVELIVKKEENSPQIRDFISKSVDIIDVREDIESIPEQPLRENYFEVNNQIEPDLVLNNSSKLLNDKVDVTTFNIDEFENSLMDLIPEVLLEEEESQDETHDINWEGEKRELVSSSYIDFSSFPENSFTGVGVSISFMVNEKGEVYEVEVIPPGSGSADFDILIKQYVSKFAFKPGDFNSKGEILIVYKK